MSKHFLIKLLLFFYSNSCFGMDAKALVLDLWANIATHLISDEPNLKKATRNLFNLFIANKHFMQLNENNALYRAVELKKITLLKKIDDTIQANWMLKQNCENKNLNLNALKFLKGIYHFLHQIMCNSGQVQNLRILHFAASSNNCELAEILLLSGYHSELQTIAEGRTALHLAVSSGAISVVETLLKHGTNVDARDQNKITPLMICACRQDAKSMKIAEFLVRNKADVHAQTITGSTALHFAFMKNNLSMIKFLLAKKADLYVKNNYGQMPLDFFSPLQKAIFFRIQKVDEIDYLSKSRSGCEN